MSEALMTPEELAAKKTEVKMTIVQMREEKRKKLEEARLKAAGIVGHLMSESGRESGGLCG